MFFHVDNLGFGELSCYSGRPLRGTWTRRIDAFAEQGYRLTNYAPEAQCTPTRSTLLTGRYSIRSGNHTRAAGLTGRLWPGSRPWATCCPRPGTAARYTASGTSGKGRDGGRPRWSFRKQDGLRVLRHQPHDPFFHRGRRHDCNGTARALFVMVC